MYEVDELTAAHPLWQDMIAYAEACPWSAGPYLAREMRAGRFGGWERVFCLLDDGKISGFCNFTEKDELSPEYSFTPFVGFVYVEQGHRGRRLSQRMLDAVTEYAGRIGFRQIYLMTGEKGLYEKYGFQKIGDYPTIFGTTDQLFVKTI